MNRIAMNRKGMDVGGREYWLVEENLDNTGKCFKSILEAFIMVRKMEHARQDVRNHFK